MTAKKILSVGFELATDDVEDCSFNSEYSLLDWDIVLFRPDIQEFISYGDFYKGKPSLSDGRSFNLKERSDHWRREIKDSYENGRTIIVFLTNLKEVFIDTGERTYSGSGRNQKTTRIVSEFDNYKCLPLSIDPINTKGSAIKLASKNAEIIAPYWSEFGTYSQYTVILNGKDVPACLITKNGDKPVGAIYRNKNSGGAIVLLPDIEFYREDFLEEKEGEQVWTAEAFQFSARLVSAVVALDKAFKSAGEITPEPDWVKIPDFELDREKELRAELLKLEKELEVLQSHKEKLMDEMRDSGRLRNLLFEKGKPLEYAIIASLEILGFKASQYKDSESEFDVVFESSEGRLIGEAEGKDNKPINIDKLRQLAMNIHEDLMREGVDKPAKGALFGNPYRLLALAERQLPFTDKCISAASSTSVALVVSSDLFKVAQYLTNNVDVEYAKKCRESIVNGIGIIEFPALPVTSQLETETQQAVEK